MTGIFKFIYHVAGLYFICLLCYYSWQRFVNKQTPEEALKQTEKKFKL